MISKSNVKSVPCDSVFVVIYFKTMYNKTIIRFGFGDIRNNQGLGKCYQPRPSARLITLTSTLIIPDITKNSSNNCLISTCNLEPLIVSGLVEITSANRENISFLGNKAGSL